MPCSFFQCYVKESHISALLHYNIITILQQVDTTFWQKNPRNSILEDIWACKFRMEAVRKWSSVGWNPCAQGNATLYPSYWSYCENMKISLVRKNMQHFLPPLPLCNEFPALPPDILVQNYCLVIPFGAKRSSSLDLWGLENTSLVTISFKIVFIFSGHL